MSGQYKTNKIVSKKWVHFSATDTLLKNCVLCYNYDQTLDMDGTTVAEGGGCNSRFLEVEKPTAANAQFIAGILADGYEGKVGPCDVQIIELVPGQIFPVRTNANCVNGQTVLGVTDDSYVANLANGADDVLPIGVAMETVDRSSTNGVVLIKVIALANAISLFVPTRNIATGDAYGVRFVGDNFFVETGTSSRSWLVGISGDKNVAGGNDTAYLRISGNNYAANAETLNFRGLNCNISNRSGGIVGALENLISVSAKQGSVNAIIRALNVDTQSLSADASDEFGGLDISLNREGGVGTKEYGIRVRTRGTINAAHETALLFEKGTDYGFNSLLKVDAAATLGIVAATGDTAHDSGDICIPVKVGSAVYYIVAQDSLG